MEKIVSQVKRFVNDETGASAVEYGLMLSLIAIAVLGGAAYVGNETNKTFDSVAGTLNTANN